MRRLLDMRRVRAMLTGDRRAAERWVVGEYPTVYRMLRSLTGTAEAAEDLTQQTFVAAWQSLGSYRGEATLRTWLLRIAYHQYTHWLRQKRESVPLDEAGHLDDPTCADGLATVMLQRALESLPDEMRETFLLFYVQEMSIKEISRLMDVPAGTVKSRLFAARKALRPLLTESPVESEAKTDAETTVEVTL